MTRRNWINVHIYLAAFLAPMIILVASSGGLYLLGIKGSVEQEPVQLAVGSEIDLNSSSLKADVELILKQSNIDHSFEYIKQSGSSLYTRPTSKTYYEFNVSDTGVSALKSTPDLQKRMIELHKGHGPLIFKVLQQIFAFGLLAIILSGVVLGITTPAFRSKTLTIIAVGFATLFSLLFFG